MFEKTNLVIFLFEEETLFAFGKKETYSALTKILSL